MHSSTLDEWSLFLVPCLELLSSSIFIMSLRPGDMATGEEGLVSCCYQCLQTPQFSPKDGCRKASGKKEDSYFECSIAVILWLKLTESGW